MSTNALVLEEYPRRPRGVLRRQKKRSRQKRRRLSGNERRIARGFLDSEILFLLKNDPLSLYSIRQSLNRTFENLFSFGTLHPHLESLENEGLIKSVRKSKKEQHGPHKMRVYSLTRKGRNRFEKEIALLANIVLKMSK